jgi:hypothetical protein
VQVRQCRPRALLDDDRLEVAEHRVLRRRRDALVRQHAGDQHRLCMQAAKDDLEVRVEEGAETDLLDDPVLGRNLEVVVDLVSPRPPAEAAVAQEGAQLHERTAVVGAAGAVPRPDHGHARGPAGGDEPLSRFDHPAHVPDVDAALRVPALRVQEVTLVVDHDDRGVAGNELPADGFVWRRHESSRRFCGS